MSLENHISVTRVVWKGFDWVDLNHRMILAGVIGSTVVHVFFCLMLVLGAILYNRSLFIPWMVSDMIIIILMVVTFTCWTFMSFFVDLLVAFVFPVQYSPLEESALLLHPAGEEGDGEDCHPAGRV